MHNESTCTTRFCYECDANAPMAELEYEQSIAFGDYVELPPVRGTVVEMVFAGDLAAGDKLADGRVIEKVLRIADRADALALHFTSGERETVQSETVWFVNPLN